MDNKAKIRWTSFICGESELECKNENDVNKLWEVCNKNNVYCGFIDKNKWLNCKSSYWYVRDNCLHITKYTLESDIICECWTVKDYIENYTYYEQEMENKNMGLDCSMIRNVRVPHEQFIAIKNKAQYLIVEDRDKGGCINFTRDKEMSDEEADKMLDDMKNKIDDMKSKLEEIKGMKYIKMKELNEKDKKELIKLLNNNRRVLGYRYGE